MTAIREFAEEHGPEEANKRADEVVIGREYFERAVESVEPTLGS